MKVGVLTGGGDCPGLNAVIRAVSRRVLDRGDTVVGVLHGWRGLLEGQTVELGERDISGILPRGGTILRTSRTNPFGLAGDGGASSGRPLAARRPGRDWRRGHAWRGRPPPRGAWVPHRRRAQDDRQRHLRHRRHLRVRHRGHDRHRGHRPPPLHRRVARPRDGVRGDGATHRLDRAHGGNGRRRRHDPDPRAAAHRRAVLRG